jgi:hypothetical protein
VSTDTNQPPVWDAARIETERARIHEHVDAYSGEYVIAAAELRSLLDEMESVRDQLEYTAECFHTVVHGIRDSQSFRGCDRPVCRHAAQTVGDA